MACIALRIIHKPDIGVKKICLYELVNTYLLRKTVIISLTFATGILLSFPVNAQTWSLAQCIDTALENNKNLLMARDDLHIAGERNKEAIAALFPKINVNGDYRYYIDLPYQLMPESSFGGPSGSFREVQFGVPHNISASAQVSVPLFDPQIYGGIKTTSMAMEIDRLLYQKTKEEVYWEVTNLYYNAQVLLNQKSLLDSNLIAINKLHENTALLLELELAQKTDVNRVKLQLEQLNIQREQVQSHYLQVLNALKITMGISIDEGLEIEKEVKFNGQADYDRQSTIEMQLATAQLRMISSEIDNLKQSRLPSLSLFGSYGVSGFGYTETPNDFLNFYPVSLVGMKVSYPLFRGTALTKKINQKRIELRKNETKLNLISSQNDMQIENAWKQKATAENKVKASESQIELAQSIYDEMSLRHKQRLATLTDVLLADNDLREAQQSYITAVVDYLKADLELKKATGSIFK